METKKFTRKPFLVEGVRVTADNMPAVAEWCGGEIHSTPPQKGLQRYVRVPVVPGAKKMPFAHAFEGDWVVKMRMGFKVYSDRNMRKDYNHLKEAACGRTEFTADHKPCVLGKDHLSQAVRVGCRSLQDYLVVNKSVLEEWQNYVNPNSEKVTDPFAKDGGVRLFPPSEGGQYSTGETA